MNVLPFAVLALIGVVIFVLIKLKGSNKSETIALFEHIQSTLPGFTKVDVAQIVTMSSHDVFEIADTVEAVVFPRVPFELNHDSKLRMRQSLVEALVLHTKLTPAQAMSLSVMDDDQLATVLGSLKAIFETAKAQGR
jgi:hypothetical protein